MKKNQKKLIAEAFKHGFTKGQASRATGEEMGKAFEDIWSYYEQTTFNKPEWKPHLESAKKSYRFCFENGFALGVHQGAVVSAEQAFVDWFKVHKVQFVEVTQND